MSADLPFLTLADLRRLAGEHLQAEHCPLCGGLSCKGWEAIPGGFDASVLQKVGTLRDPAIEDPTLDEFHPAGTHGWSADAPIALRFHPYNRCDVWQCSGCRKAYLRYTEFGGYYQEQRIREVDPLLIVDAGA